MASRNTPQIAVWYFVAATFIFASTTLFIPDAEMWLRILTLAVGLLLVIGGGIQLGKEIRDRRGDSA